MSLVRTTIAGLAASGLLLGIAWARADGSREPPFRIVQRGSVILPQTARDRDGTEVAISGLSGIAWLGGDRYAAIMDNSDKLLLFSLEIASDGTPQAVSGVEVVTLAERHDYEDVAVCPQPLHDRLVARRLRDGLPPPGPCLLVVEEDTPAIRAVSIADGSMLGVIPIPEIYKARRFNRGLESLDVDPDGRHVWTANEEALPADGPAATVGGGTVVRLSRIAIPEVGQQTDRPVQFAYAVDPPHQFVRVFAGEPLSGVAAVTALDENRMVVLERSGCPGLPPFESRMYLVDTQEGDDVAAVEGDLPAHAGRHLRKALLWHDQLGCNVEGLCLGPKLGRSGRVLVAIADNNGIGTPNQVIGFVVERPTAGISLPLVVAGGTLAAILVGLVLYRLAR